MSETVPNHTGGQWDRSRVFAKFLWLRKLVRKAFRRW
jgi:hypothetical protein